MHTFVSNCLQEKSYLLTTPQGYIVIDPGVGVFDKIKPYIKDFSTCVVLLTHMHFDHVFDARFFQERGAKVALHTKDVKLLASKANLAFTSGLAMPKLIPDILLEEGTYHFAGENVQVVHTPGHTPGSCCFYVQDQWFTGDTIFPDGFCGRTDFPGGNENDMQKSIEKIKQHIQNKFIYAGH